MSTSRNRTGWGADLFVKTGAEVRTHRRRANFLQAAIDNVEGAENSERRALPAGAIACQILPTGRDYSDEIAMSKYGLVLFATLSLVGVCHPCMAGRIEPFFPHFVGIEPQGKWLLGESYDPEKLIVISATNGAVLRTIPDKVMKDSVQISADGSIVAIYAHKIVRAWKAENGSVEKTSRNISLVKSAPREGSFEQQAHAAYLKRYKGPHSSNTLTSTVSFFSRDGRYAIVTSGMEGWSYDLWDVSTKRLVATVPRPRHGCDIGGVADFDTDGKTIIIQHFMEGDAAPSIVPIEAFELRDGKVSPKWHWHCRPPG